MNKIHATAIIDTNAILGEEVEIGPYCVIGPNVKIGDGVRLFSHVVLDGYTTLGNRCEVHPFARIGGATQDLKYVGGKTYVEVGDETVLREYVTINCGTRDGEVTKVGAKTLLMGYCHVAHGCNIGNEVIVSNNTQFAGEVMVEDRAVISGMMGVHQFCRIGTLAMVSCARLSQDAPPYMITQGTDTSAHVAVCGINQVGLTRRGYSEETRTVLKQAYKLLCRSEMNVSDALAKIEETLPAIPEIHHLVNFYRSSSRGVIR